VKMASPVIAPGPCETKEASSTLGVYASVEGIGGVGVGDEVVLET
jgi:hypothetical protein